jgi:hypothetical protein
MIDSPKILKVGQVDVGLPISITVVEGAFEVVEYKIDGRCGKAFAAGTSRIDVMAADVALSTRLNYSPPGPLEADALDTRGWATRGAELL